MDKKYDDGDCRVQKETCESAKKISRLLSRSMAASFFLSLSSPSIFPDAALLTRKRGATAEHAVLTSRRGESERTFTSCSSKEATFVLIPLHLN